jgi:hypothetical protein
MTDPFAVFIRNPRPDARHVGTPNSPKPPSPARASSQCPVEVASSPAINLLPADEPQSRGPTARPSSRPSRSTRNAVGVAMTPYRLVTSPSASRRMGIVTFFSLAQVATVDWLSWMLMAQTESPRPDRSRCSCSTVEGNSLVQCGHQVAQK